MAKTIELWIEDHKLVALGYNEDYAGTPIVFIHGITSSVDFWEPLLPQAFKGRYRWYSLTLPGHYPAVMPPRFREEDLSAEMMARVLSEALYRLAGDKPVIVVGHSTGGFAAVHLAAQAPGIVKGVVSVSGFAQGTWIGALGLNQKIAALPVVGNAFYKLGYWLIGRSKEVWKQSWGVYTASSSALAHNPLFDQAVENGYPNFTHLNLDVMAMYFRRMPHIDISAVLPQIRVPMLVIVGDKDPIVPSSQSQLIAQKVQGSELVTIAGAGHIPMLEHADEFSRALLGWIDNHA
ncbi:MAG: alpha/beta hydrolase [Anaerolineae bacterium]